MKLTCGLLLLLVAGCATSGPMTFHDSYMQGQLPDQPSNEIVFNDDVNQRITNFYDAYDFFDRVDGCIVSPQLFWFDEDNVIFKIGDHGTFLITPNDKTVSVLEGAELEAVLNRIENRVSVINTDTRANTVIGALASAMSNNEFYCLPFSCEIKDVNTPLKINIKIHRGKHNFSSVYSVKATGFIENPDNGLRTPIPFAFSRVLSQRCVENVLRANLQNVWASPSGKKIMFSHVLYDLHQGSDIKPTTLIFNPDFCTSVVNPAWNKIVLLRTEEIEKKDIFRLEFYDLKGNF